MKSFQDWSIRRKITLHILIILALVIFHLVGIWWFPQQVENTGTAINEAGEQRLLTQKMALQTHLVGMGDDEKRGDLADSADEFNRTLTDLIEGNETRNIPSAPPEVREQLLTVKTEWKPFYTHVQTVTEKPRSSQEFNSSLAYIQAHHRQLLSESDQAVQQYEQLHEARIQRTRTIFYGLLALDLILIPPLIVMINRQLLRPIDWMTDDAEIIAAGDFDRQITAVDSNDEIGRLSRSLQEMRDQLVSSIQQVKRFEQAVEHAGHAIYITNTEGTIKYVNPAFEEITNYNEAQAVGETPRILKSGQQPGSFYEDLWETILEGEVWEDDIVNERASGELFHAHQTIAPITDSDENLAGFVAIMTDNTEQIVNAQQNQVLSRVLRHNLRTELNLIDGYAQEIKSADDGASRIEYTEKIRARVDSLVALSDMAERSVRVCQQGTYRQSQGLSTAIEYVRTTMAERYSAATITVDKPDYEIDLLANIELVLEELVENAIEHNDSANPTISVTAMLQEETGPPPTVRIEVADNGPGIPSEERKVLERGKETPLFHGSGLGLWLVHWVVTLAGGTVTIEDRSSRGSRIVLTLPRASVRPFADGSLGEETHTIGSTTDTETSNK